MSVLWRCPSGLLVLVLLLSTSLKAASESTASVDGDGHSTEIESTTSSSNDDGVGEKKDVWSDGSNRVVFNAVRASSPSSSSWSSSSGWVTEIVVVLRIGEGLGLGVYGLVAQARRPLEAMPLVQRRATSYPEHNCPRLRQALHPGRSSSHFRFLVLQFRHPPRDRFVPLLGFMLTV